MFIYRHNEDMIKRLESAGLGFFIKASETQQKLGIAILSLNYTLSNQLVQANPLVVISHSKELLTEL